METDRVCSEHPRVLHVGKFYPPHMGGIETHIQALAEGQSRELEVSVLVANDGPKTATSVVNGVRVVRVASLGVVSSQPVCPTLAWRIRQANAQVVHLHLPNPAAAAAYLASGHEGALVVTHHSDILGRQVLGRLVHPVVRRLMERADVVLTTSKRYALSSLELRPFLAKCRTVSLGIDTAAARMCSPEAMTSVRERFGPAIILAVGRLVPYKGFEYLIKAMEGVPATLVIVGVGPLRERLRQLAAHSRLRNVHLVGHVEDLAAYYRAAEVVVLPSVSRAEAFGLVQLEAMACGKPVINTELDSGVPEVSLHGRTGLTVPPRDHGALAQAINILISNPGMARKFGLAGFSRVQSEFDVRTMVERTIAIYREVQARSQGKNARAGAAA